MVRRIFTLLVMALIAVIPDVVTAFPVSVVDDRCQEILVEAAPHRILVLLPFYAEILLKLDVGDRIVGITDFPEDLPGLYGIPSVGPAHSPSREQIVALRPDIVFGATDWDGLRGSLESVGVKVLTVGCFGGVPDLGSITGPADVFRVIEAVSTVNPGSNGTEIVKRIREDLATVARVVKNAERRSVAVVYPDVSGVSAPTVAGRGTPEYTGMKAAGGMPVFDHEGYMQISFEELVRADPEFLIVDPARLAEVTEDLRLADMRAVRGQRVCGIKASGWTSTSVAASVLELATILHPVLFNSEFLKCKVLG